METVMGVLSLFLALGAIWFTSEILKRLRQSHDPALDRHVYGLNAVIAQNDRALKMLNQRLREVEQGIQGLKSGMPASQPASPVFDEYRQPEPHVASAEADSDARRFQPSINISGNRSVA